MSYSGGERHRDRKPDGNESVPPKERHQPQRVRRSLALGLEQIRIARSLSPTEPPSGSCCSRSGPRSSSGPSRVFRTEMGRRPLLWVDSLIARFPRVPRRKLELAVLGHAVSSSRFAATRHHELGRHFVSRSFAVGLDGGEIFGVYLVARRIIETGIGEGHGATL